MLDGTIKFVQKVVPVTDSAYSFIVDERPVTLYFIPDKDQFPEYVPTILGESVILQPTSFITLTESRQVIFNILKKISLAPGGKIISGRVTTSEGGRVAEGVTIQSVENISVVLMINTGQVVSTTETDATGYYEFSGLPDDVYQVMVLFPLNEAQMPPVEVDITLLNAELNIVVSPSGSFDTEINAVLLAQSIQFDELPSVVALDTAPFVLVATTSSGLPVSFTSNAESVATVSGNMVTLVGEGTVTITALQHGSAIYKPAEIVERTFQVVQITAAEDPLANISVSPNPVTDFLFVNAPFPLQKVTITDVVGRSADVSSEGKQIDLRSFQPGLYLIRVAHGNRNRTLKIVRQ